MVKCTAMVEIGVTVEEEVKARTLAPWFHKSLVSLYVIIMGLGFRLIGGETKM